MSHSKNEGISNLQSDGIAWDWAVSHSKNEGISNARCGRSTRQYAVSHSKNEGRAQNSNRRINKNIINESGRTAGILQSYEKYRDMHVLTDVFRIWSSRVCAI